MAKKKEEKRVKYKKYSQLLENAWRKDRVERDDSLYDWIDTAFDREEEIKKKDTLATYLFILGLLLGSLETSLILLLCVVS